MPNRILKESICTSASVDGLSWFEEVLFYRLIVNCDDYGRFDGRLSIIKNRLFPLKENLTLKDVSAAINTLANAGIIALYEFEGKPYLYLPAWNEHQSVRAKRSKYPAPDDGVKKHEIICKQMHSNESKCPRNPIQSVSESESESKCAERGEIAASTPPVITLPLNDGSEWPVTEAMATELGGLYPAVDVAQALRSMRGWLLNNPKKRKTKSGISRFMNSWLAREQDRGGNQTSARSQSANPYAQMAYDMREVEP